MSPEKDLPCICGHAVEQHPDRAACTAADGTGKSNCDCVAYEADDADADDDADETD